MWAGGIDHHGFIRAKRLKLPVYFDRDLPFKDVKDFCPGMSVRRMGTAARLNFGNVNCQFVGNQTRHSQQSSKTFCLDIRKIHFIASFCFSYCISNSSISVINSCAECTV